MSQPFRIAFLCLIIGSALAGVGIAVYRTSRGARTRDRIAIGLTVALTLIGFAVPMSSISEWDSERHVPVRVAILATEIPITLWAITVALAAFLVLSGFLQKRGRLIAFGAVWAVFAGPTTCCVSFARRPAPWQSHESVRHPNGVRYAFLESSFLQGQSLVLARQIEPRWYGTAYAGIAQTNGDSPRTWAPVIRPRGRDRDGQGQLHLAPDGRVVAIRSNNHCYMVYDPASRVFWAHEPSVRTISPFILLGPSDEPCARDIEATLAAMSEIIRLQVEQNGSGAQLDELSGFPAEPLLREGLSHANPRVRVLAERLLKHHRALVQQAGYPAQDAPDATTE